jgi:periplasmic protein TonB
MTGIAERSNFVVLEAKGIMKTLSYRAGVIAALLTVGLAPSVFAQTKRAVHSAPAKDAIASESAKAAEDRPVPTPLGNPSTWISTADYPPAASAAGQEGRTVFALDVDNKGRVTGCRIVQSSGSPLLDNTTCSSMVVNARFKAARGGDGKSVASVWQSAMQWKLQTTEPTDD